MESKNRQWVKVDSFDNLSSNVYFLFEHLRSVTYFLFVHHISESCLDIMFRVLCIVIDKQEAKAHANDIATYCGR